MVEIENWLTLDDNGIQMPWYTRPCLAWLETIDLKGKNIFEYGAGYSTLWFRSRGAFVTGVDSNAEWAALAGVNHIVLEKEYIGSVAAFKIYDIIVIDGSYRDDCTETALKHLRSGGLLIIDNYKQPSVQELWTKTEKLIVGMNTKLYKEPTHYDWQTLVIHV